jgi:glucan biosynthesis protein C
VEKAASADTYAVYILHVPVLIVLSITLSFIILPPLLFFVIMLAMVIVLTFVFAHVIRSIPGVSSVV